MTPPPLRRTRGERLAWIPALVMVPAGSVLTLLTNDPTGVLIGIGAGLLSVGLHVAAWRRDREELRRHRWLLCPACRHPLDARRRAGTCPECGRPYTRLGVRRAWRTRHRGYLGDPVELPPGS